MRRALLAAFVLSLLPIAAPADTATGFAPLMGSWSCKTAAGSTVAATFTTDSSGVVREQMKWTQASGAPGGSWDQTFSYDATDNAWRAHNAGSNGWLFVGVSDGFADSAIYFTGLQTEGSTVVALRERFTLGQPGHFEHVWEQAVHGTWRRTSAAQCVQDVAAGSPSPQ